MKLGRKAVGVELKPSYYNCAVQNLRKAEMINAELPLFAGLAAD